MGISKMYTACVCDENWLSYNKLNIKTLKIFEFLYVCQVVKLKKPVLMAGLRCFRNYLPRQWVAGVLF